MAQNNPRIATDGTVVTVRWDADALQNVVYVDEMRGVTMNYGTTDQQADDMAHEIVLMINRGVLKTRAAEVQA